MNTCDNKNNARALLSLVADQDEIPETIKVEVNSNGHDTPRFVAVNLLDTPMPDVLYTREASFDMEDLLVLAVIGAREVLKNG